MRARASHLACLIGTLLFGCSDNRSPLEVSDIAAPITGLGMAVVDAASGGSPYFFFLPPTVVNMPAVNGPGDNTLYPEVEVCEWSGTSCTGPLVARFDRLVNTPFAWKLRVGTSDYALVWATAQSALDPALNYRMRVILGAFELGYIDLDVVATSTQAAAVDRTRFLPVIAGSELRAKFLITKGAFFRVGMSSRTVSGLNGAVRLVVPAKALADEHHILIQHAAQPPADPARLTAPVEILPSSVPITKALTLSLRYDPTGHTGLDETTLLLKQLVGGVWQNVPGSTVNVATRTISAPIMMLGTFAIFRADPAIANAGPDAYVQMNSATTLDGSASQGTNLTYTWTPIVWDPTFGTPPTLNGATPSFTPTGVQRIVYQLQLTDGITSSTDQVELMALEDPAHAVFVAPFPVGADVNAGTRAQPVLTIANAVQKAAAMGGDVYISGNPTTFFTNAALNLATGVSIYGGF
ncbi:MAG: hypothetical protein WEE89_06820, partial [Gemmatimonadota bacterium]